MSINMGGFRVETSTQFLDSLEKVKTRLWHLSKGNLPPKAVRYSAVESNKVLVLQRGAQSEEMAEPDPAPTHKPKNSKFKQQALPAWQPILTAGSVLPTFFVIGVAFIPIGVGLMYFSDTVKEVSIEYTNCNMDSDVNKMCKDVITNLDEGYTNGLRNQCNCTLLIKEEDIGNENWAGNVFIYYVLTNFYQNH